MRWKHIDTNTRGECRVDLNGTHDVQFEVGVISTGRQRVYQGVYVKVVGPHGQEWISEDRWSPLIALREVARQIEAEGGTMMCAGLDPRFYESGLSAHSGYGYIKGYGKAIYMMEPVPRLLTSGSAHGSHSTISTSA